MLTLWDLIKPVAEALGARPRVAAPARAAVRPAPARPPAKRNSGRETAQDVYDRVVREMLAKHSIRVRRWRTSMSGMAWEVMYADRTRVRLIESPRPRGPMSAAIFLHEVGHHAIGLDRYRPRCLEEYHAWKWSLEAMEANGLSVTDAVRRRMHLSLWYAVGKASRRGIKAIPAELAPFTRKPERRSRGLSSGV